MKKEYYKRNLPHYQTRGQLFFVTWMLTNTLPSSTLAKLRREYETDKNLLPSWKNYFEMIDDQLHNSKASRYWLNRSDLAQIVADAIQYWDKKRIDLYCYCIMPNHVHSVFIVHEEDGNSKHIYLQDILESIKKFSARKCNNLLKRSGKFWQHESYDRIIRDREELYYVLKYILDNPVKARLCKNRNNWKWSYIKPDFSDLMEEPISS